MNDTLLGVLIGGSIGAVPVVLSVLAELWRNRSQRHHEIRMKQIELYEVPRRDALTAFMRYLGKLTADSHHDLEAKENYYCYARLAALYVSEETRSLMLKASDLIIKTWNESGSGVTTRDIVESEALHELEIAMARELRLAMDELETPARRRKDKGRSK